MRELVRIFNEFYSLSTHGLYYSDYSPLNHDYESIVATVDSIVLTKYRALANHV